MCVWCVSKKRSEVKWVQQTNFFYIYFVCLFDYAENVYMLSAQQTVAAFFRKHSCLISNSLI